MRKALVTHGKKLKSSHTCVIAVSGRKERDNGIENIFKEILAKYFPNS